ncbi:hypothetical protein LTR36_003354 [Oleoguttula mirabilis]|uniref:Uncharacterized protein n=1 Tax=Oleoguttula mirabilis TaxID=1507867 RepID=A0AAV9JXC5_9PEZI|nr:hypothetical protein LTR36_003354 [Oleoguttula mirabilis]
MNNNNNNNNNAQEAPEDIHALHALYAALQLEASPQRQLNFLALVRAWLLRYTPPHYTQQQQQQRQRQRQRLPLCPATLDISVLLDDATLAFLLTFGPRLWPDEVGGDGDGDGGGRGHLLREGYLTYERDFTRRRRRRRRRVGGEGEAGLGGGSDPGDPCGSGDANGLVNVDVDAELLYAARFGPGLPARQALRMYFARVNGMGYRPGRREEGRGEGEVRAEEEKEEEGRRRISMYCSGGSCGRLDRRGVATMGHARNARTSGLSGIRSRGRADSTCCPLLPRREKFGLNKPRNR